MFLPVLSGLPKESIIAMIEELSKSLVQALFYSGIWYWYLSVSKRVERTYFSYAKNIESENSIDDSTKPEMINENEIK